MRAAITAPTEGVMEDFVMKKLAGKELGEAFRNRPRLLGRDSQSGMDHHSSHPFHDPNRGLVFVNLFIMW